MTTWADVAKGDRVSMGGKVFEVAKAKLKGKKVDVVLTGHGGRFASTVKAKAEVTLADPLVDSSGRQQRWAKPAEHEASLGPLLSPGDPSVTTPPAKAKGGPWDAPADDAEKALLDGLDAVLIAEGDPDVGYYVPPVDETTVQAHLAIFHERRPLGNVVDALAAHDEEHRAAEANATLLTTNHWHVKRRARP